MTAPAPRSDSFYADLRRGVLYAFRRRAKLLATITGLVAFGVSSGLLSGQVETAANVAIAVLTSLATHQVPNLPAVASGPTPNDRATERGLPEHATPDITEEPAS